MDWRTTLIRHQILALLLLSSLLSCGHGPVPRWDGKLWAGDSKRAGITRSQTQEHIDAVDPQFDDFVAVTYADFRKLFVIIQSCQQWPKGMQMMSAEEALDRMSILMTDLEREAVWGSKSKFGNAPYGGKK